MNEPLLTLPFRAMASDWYEAGAEMWGSVATGVGYLSRAISAGSFALSLYAGCNS